MVSTPVKPRADWLERLGELQSRWLKHRSFCWWFAAYFHLIVLLTLALWIIHLPELTPPVMLTASFEVVAEQPEAEAVVQPDLEPQPAAEPDPAPNPIEPADEAADAPAAEQPESSATQAEASESSEVITPVGSEPTPAAPGEPAGGEEGEEGARPGKHAAPPAYAVTKGNFRAWTEPAMPAPGQPYLIVIEVTLPERVRRYPSSDLSGVVTGADGFRKFIRGWDQEFLPIYDRKVLVRVPIVGAERGLRDSIVVQSRILKQRQFIELTYPDMDLMLRGGASRKRRGG